MRRIALILVLLCARAAVGAVAVDTQMPTHLGIGCTACPTKTILSFTNAAGTLMLCALTEGGNSLVTGASTVTYNGSSFGSADVTKFINFNNFGFSSIYHLLNPVRATAADIVFTNNAGSGDIQVGCLTVTGNDTTTPIRATTFTNSDTSGANPSITLSVTGTTTGNLVVASGSNGACFGTGTCGSLPTTNQTMTWLLNQSGGTAGSNGQMAYAAGNGGTVSMIFNANNDQYTIAGVEVQAPVVTLPPAPVTPTEFGRRPDWLTPHALVQ